MPTRNDFRDGESMRLDNARAGRNASRVPRVSDASDLPSRDRFSQRAEIFLVVNPVFFLRKELPCLTAINILTWIKYKFVKETVKIATLRNILKLIE